MSNKQNSNHNESEFALNELFFSTTDKIGNIVAVNDVFVRVSKYDSADLIGAPHNIIRHPDMPKCVFKLLWETIAKEKSIVAYVKNRARDGSFYWVLATVFPTEEGYLSIRIKPTSKYLDIIKELYPKVLAEEKKGGIESGSAYLMKFLSTVGFSDYSEFMTTVLLEEMSVRDKALGQQSLTSLESKVLGGLVGIRSIYVRIFEKLAKFTEYSKRLKQLSSETFSLCGDLRLLSFNLVMAASRLGEQGRTISTIAQRFETMALEIQSEVEMLQESMDILVGDLHKTEINMGITRLEAEMIFFFLKSWIERVESGVSNVNQDRSDVQKNSELFFKLCQTVFLDVGKQIQVFPESLRKFSEATNALKSSILELEIVRTSGKVESKQGQMVEENTADLVKSMVAFIVKIRAPINETSQAIERMNQDLSEIILEFSDITHKFCSFDLEKNMSYVQST